MNAPWVNLEVPGRLCLFGEHSDWAAAYRHLCPELSPGQCLVAGTTQRLLARVRRSSGVTLRSATRGGSDSVSSEFPADSGALDRSAADGGFFAYACGAAAEVMSRHSVGGIEIEIGGDLPVRKGLSSSAAVSVLVARAYDRCYQLGLDIEDEMDLAYCGERRTGSECGRMDFVCALGGGVSLLHFDRDRMEIEELTMDDVLEVVLVDLGGTKDTLKILRDLNRCFPDDPEPAAARVREALGPRSLQITSAARVALEGGDGETVGALMTEAQEVFDQMVAPACAELEAPRLHHLLSHGLVEELSWGGKGVGSQGDGCAQLVARGACARDELLTRIPQELGMRCFPLTVKSGSVLA